MVVLKAFLNGFYDVHYTQIDETSIIQTTQKNKTHKHTQFLADLTFALIQFDVDFGRSKSMITTTTLVHENLGVNGNDYEITHVTCIQTT